VLGQAPFHGEFGLKGNRLPTGFHSALSALSVWTPAMATSLMHLFEFPRSALGAGAPIGSRDGFVPSRRTRSYSGLDNQWRITLELSCEFENNEGQRDEDCNANFIGGRSGLFVGGPCIAGILHSDPGAN
jgi:hypothetical protein